MIGNFLGKFVKHDVVDTGAACRSFRHVRVELEVEKLLKKMMKLTKRDGLVVWVTFRYERLVTFCFFCGKMGHSDKYCVDVLDSLLTPDKYPYGLTLRAAGGRQRLQQKYPWLVAEGTYTLFFNNNVTAQHVTINEEVLSIDLSIKGKM